MHLSCWIPAISVNYSASALQLVHLFFLVDELPYSTQESVYKGEHPYMSRSLQDYNFKTLIQQKGSDLRKANRKSFDGLALNQQRTTKMKIVFKIIDQRVHLKVVVVGKLSWDGQAFLREKKPFVVINEHSASGRTRPFLFSDITRLAGRKNGNLIQLNASCLVPSKHLTRLDIIIVNMMKKYEVNYKSVPGFVFVENQSSSVFTPRDVTSLEHVNETELHNEYQGSGRAAARKLQLVILYGKWKPWTEWSKCSSVCGKSGLSVRERKCGSLPQIQCEGIGFDMRECIPGVRCQAKFSDWGNWGPCSTSCGEGVRARSRVCVTEDQGLKCNGMSSVLERCAMPKCGPKHRVVVYPALPPGSFPAFMKGKHLVAQKYYMFPAKLVQRGDLEPHPSPAQRSPWAFQPPPDIEETPSEVELYLNIRVPEPPVRAPPRRQSKRTSPVDPFIWGDWGRWSVCSKKCGDGYRLRKRMCIDHSQTSDVRVKAMWCGKGDLSQMVHCMGSCSPVQSEEEGQFLSSKLRVVESEGRGGPHVKAHDRLAEKMNIQRAEIVETGSHFGPNVVFSSDKDKSGPVSKVVVEETGGKGPIVHSEHELESSTTEPEAVLEIGDLQLTAETILFIVLFLVCVLLLIGAFFVYFLQRIIAANTRKQMLAANPLYKPDDGREEDLDEEQPMKGLVKPVVLQKKEPPGLSFKEKKIIAESRSRKPKGLKAKIPQKNLKQLKKLIAHPNKDASGFPQIRNLAT